MTQSVATPEVYTNGNGTKLKNDFYTGLEDVAMPDRLLAELTTTERIEGFSEKSPWELKPHKCFRHSCEYGGNILSIYDEDIDCLVWVNHPKFFKQFKDGTQPLNDEQILAYHMLVDTKIRLITMFGGPGRGKTLLSFNAGISQLGKIFDKILVFRANVDMGGRSLGSIPGDENIKINQWGKSIFTILDILSENKLHKTGRPLPDYIAKKKIEILVPNYERGNTHRRALVIIDDCQNFDIDTVSGLVSRADKETKYVLLGDINRGQKDNRYIKKGKDALSKALIIYEGKRCCAQIELVKNERSYLSELGAMLQN